MSRRIATSVHFNFNAGSHETTRTNEVLDNFATDAECIAFLETFFGFWDSVNSGSTAERRASLAGVRQIIGRANANLFGVRLMFTLTSDGRQFRCWYGVPGCMEAEHVDSCGTNLLFSVYGMPEVVQRFIGTLIPRLSSIRMPNGTTVWGLWWWD